MLQNSLCHSKYQTPIGSHFKYGSRRTSEIWKLRRRRKVRFCTLGGMRPLWQIEHPWTILLSMRMHLTLDQDMDAKSITSGWFCTAESAHAAANQTSKSYVNVPKEKPNNIKNKNSDQQSDGRSHQQCAHHIYIHRRQIRLRSRLERAWRQKERT